MSDKDGKFNKPERGSSPLPDHIMLSFWGDAKTSAAISWRTDENSGDSYILYRREGSADLLRQEGLAVTVEFISDNTVDAYTVVRCDPEPGAQLTAGQLVRLVVVRPQADPFRAVPRVIGLSVQQAKHKLLQAGLHAEVMGGAQEGTVTSQDPLPSHLLHANGGVKLYIN